jgi:hypothetical protein
MVWIPDVKIVRQNTCIGQLILIESAKAQWALDHKRTNGPVTWNDVLPYMGRGAKILTCPAGATYTVGNVEERAKCSVAGHALTP